MTTNGSDHFIKLTKTLYRHLFKFWFEAKYFFIIDCIILLCHSHNVEIAKRESQYFEYQRSNAVRSCILTFYTNHWILHRDRLKNADQSKNAIYVPPLTAATLNDSLRNSHKNPINFMVTLSVCFSAVLNIFIIIFQERFQSTASKW